MTHKKPQGLKLDAMDTPLDCRLTRRLTRRQSLICASASLVATSNGSAQESAPIAVRVVSESWDHLIELNAQGRAQGPIADFVNRMNAVQSRFDFQWQVVPRLRVNRMFIQGEADLYPLRTLDWVEPELRLQASRALLEASDVYIARRDNRYGGARIFDELPARLIAGVRGYHYRLFDNNPDEQWITQRFRAQLLPSNGAVIRFVEMGRAEVGIVPEAIMAKVLQDPKMREALIVAERYDSRVQLSHLVRKDGPITVAELNAILELLFRAGDVDRLRQHFRIAR